MQGTQVILSTWPAGSPEGRFGKSGTEIVRSGDAIHFEYCDHDDEDRKSYTYTFDCNVTELRQMIEELRRSGRAILVRSPTEELTMVLDGEDVAIKVSGYGGSNVYSTVPMSCKLSDLLPK